MPRIRVIVHSFANGGATATFNSPSYQNSKIAKYQNIKVSKHLAHPTPADIKKREDKKEADVKRREQLFKDHMSYWQNGSSAIGAHGYVLNKKLDDNRDLKVNRNKLLIPIANLDGEFCAIQSIDYSGRKFIFGKKKGGFVSIGDYESAKRLYFCEGYATADAVHKLVTKAQKRKVPFAVIAGLDNHNMEYVLGLFKEKFKNKIFTVCADNDCLKVSEKNLNAGLLSGLNCVLNHRCEIKAIPNDLIENCHGSDWWDVYHSDQDLALEYFANTEKHTRFESAIARLSCFRLKDKSISLKKATAYALHVAASLYPARLDEDVILKSVTQAVEYTSLSQKDISRWWVKIKRRIFAQSLRAKSIQRKQEEGVSIVHIASLEDAHDKVQELKKNHTKAVFITNAPMGTGKTKHFIQPEFMLSDIKGDIPIVITPTRSLTKGVSERFGSSHYIEDGQSLRKSGNHFIPDALAITVNSIISNKFNEVFEFSKSVFIDEYTQVLRSITLGTVEDHLRKKTELRLASLINNSNYAFIADADFNQIALDQVKEVVEASREIFIFIVKEDKVTHTQNDSTKVFLDHGGNPNKQVIADQNEKASNEANNLNDIKNPVEYRFLREKDNNFTHKFLVNEIEKAAVKEQKIYIASDSKAQIDLIASILDKHKIDSLMIHSDNVNFPKQKKFLDNPNAYLENEKPQVVLVSPSIQSGVSIEVDYFERCFGLYKGTVTPSVFQQMLHRVRPQRVFELSLPSRLGSTIKESENATAILMGAYQQHIQQFGGVGQVTYDPKTNVHSIGQIKIAQEGSKLSIEGDDDYARFETLCAQTKALDNQQLHNSANYLLIQAIARDVKITPIDINIKDSEKELLKVSYKYNKVMTEKSHVEKILNAEVINENEYNKCTVLGGAKTSEEHYKILRYDIANDLNKPSEKLTLQDISFHLDQGQLYVANYQALKQGTEKAKEHDTNDKNAGVAKTSAKWRESKVKLLRLIFDTLEIDVESGAGQYTQEEANKTRAAIKQDDTLQRYITFKL
ncbi:hypothetical protein N8865_03055, partial [Francisellaceae bacterium]|nr:hypothetical protein [Francisellaceae bacterium]